MVLFWSYFRLLTTGTIEEKMYQRQVSKQTLAGGIVDIASSKSVLLSKEELKDIFSPCEDVETCLTHMTLGCECNGSGVAVHEIGKENRSCQVESNPTTSGPLKMEDLLSWEHHGKPFSDELLSDLNLSDCSDHISFVFVTSC